MNVSITGRMSIFVVPFVTGMIGSSRVKTDASAGLSGAIEKLSSPATAQRCHVSCLTIFVWLCTDTS